MADTDTNAAAPRLLPANENFLDDLLSLEEPLLMRLSQTTRDARADDEEVRQLPPSLDGEKAHNAWRHIVTALPQGLRNEWYAVHTGSGQQTKDSRHVYGPDGGKLIPLYAVFVDQADVDVLAALLGDCRKAVAREEGYIDLYRLLSDAGEHYGSEYGCQPETAQQVTDRLSRALAVLQMERDADVEMLLQAVSAAGPDGRVDLTAAQKAVAERFMDRVITATTARKQGFERDPVRRTATVPTSRRRQVPNSGGSFQ